MSTAAALLAAAGPGARFVSRPSSGVLHLYVGPMTPSGRFVPSDRRTVCRARTRRLSVVEPAAVAPLDRTGRRVCVRCSVCPSPRCGQAEQAPVSRDQYLAAYRHLTLGDLGVLLELATTVDETHKVGFLTALLFGPPPVRRNLAGTPEREALFDLNAAIITRRQLLKTAERTPEETAALEQKREADAHNAALLMKARRKDAHRDRVIDRRNRGQYLTPYERDLVS